MPLKDYGVLVGRVVDARREGGQDTPHYQIEVDGGGTRFRVAVNVLSQLAPSELLFLADEKFDHPLLPGLAGLPDGFTAIVRAPGGAAGVAGHRTRPGQRPGGQPGSLRVPRAR
jgi:uncharacterized protein YukJ